MIKEYVKTAPIHAIQWTGEEDCTQEVLDWAASYGVDIRCVWDFSYVDGVGKLEIPTLEGPIFASIGDYIAKGVADEFWPIKPGVMALTYKEVV